MGKIRKKYTDKEKALLVSLREKINYYRAHDNLTKLSDNQIIEMYYMFNGNLDHVNPDYAPTDWYFAHLIGGSERILLMGE